MINVSEQFPLGVCVLPEAGMNASRTVANPTYIHEILGHAGLCYSTVQFDELSETLPKLGLLVTIGETELASELKDNIRAWVLGGGAWISIAGTCGMENLFGVEAKPASFENWSGALGMLGEGYLNPSDKSHPVLEHLEIPLHYFNGNSVRISDGILLAGILDAHGRPDNRAAVVESMPGDGRCMLIAPDITGAIVRIQQGVCITRDGVPSSDGTAQSCDGALKTDDGRVLDWILDRQNVPGVPGLQGFLEPVADQWKELLLRAIFYLANEKDISLPVLWLYPRNLPALAHMSHDTDNNEPEKAQQLLDVLDKSCINSTWCVIRPGYSSEIMNAIREAGHELAMHHDAITDMLWSEDNFDQQWKELVALFDGENPVTNKNHYLRWEGDTEFYNWCEKRGIKLDESKGPSKTGEVGFIFGTSQPFFPVDPNGNKLDVLELPTLTQDLIVFAPTEVLDPLLFSIFKTHGILHLLFHPAHVDKDNMEDTILSSIKKAKELGLEWWTAAKINSWERARRTVRWSDYLETENGVSVKIESAEPLEEASVLWLTGLSGGININSSACESISVNRWGFSFQSVVTDIKKDSGCTIAIIAGDI